jgi:hypothetical protein
MAPFIQFMPAGSAATTCLELVVISNTDQLHAGLEQALVVSLPVQPGVTGEQLFV